MRRRPLTLRGVLMLGIGIMCLVTANLMAAPILSYIGVLLLAVPALSAIIVLVPRQRGVVQRRLSTGLVPVGERAEVHFTATLRGVGPVPGSWRDLLPAAVSGTAEGLLPLDQELRYTITAERRGVWPLGPLQLTTFDPFGLAQRRRAVGDTATIVIAPAVVALLSLEIGSGGTGGTAQTSASRLGQGADNLSPRPYMTGDSMRRIHWRATAHRGDLMVRQEEEEASPDALVILDRSAAQWAEPSSDPDPAFEAAVSACASIALHLAHEGYRVDVVDSAGLPLGALRGHDGEREPLLITLAEIAPEGTARPVAALVEGVPGPLVLITGRLQSSDIALLRHGGAAAPVLLSADPEPGAIEAALARGWSAARLGDDIRQAWSDARPRHATAVGDSPVRNARENDHDLR